MQMRPDLQIQSMIKALMDVVLPAIDPANKLAQEQARLVIGTLALMSKQLPLQFRFDCDELERLIAFSAELQQQSANAGSVATQCAALAEKTAAAADVLGRAQAGPAKVLNAVRELRAASGEVISAVFREADEATQDRVQRTVLAMSAAQLLRDRAWLLSQNWEPDPAAVPSIESLLEKNEV